MYWLFHKALPVVIVIEGFLLVNWCIFKELGVF